MLPSFAAALDAFGADRMLYSVDHPFGSLELGRAFLQELPRRYARQAYSRQRRTDSSNSQTEIGRTFHDVRLV
jgi:hypothetical protein